MYDHNPGLSMLMAFAIRAVVTNGPLKSLTASQLPRAPFDGSEIVFNYDSESY